MRKQSVIAAFVMVGAAAPAFAAGTAADPWRSLVGHDRATVVKEVGPPSLEFTTLVDAGEEPLQLTPGGGPDAAALEPDLPTKPRKALRVLQYDGGERGMDFQVVLDGDAVAWAVTPPAADEKDLAAVTKKYGKPAKAGADVFHADILRHWEVLAYPKKGVAFVRHPGEKAIVARVFQTPTTGNRP